MKGTISIRSSLAIVVAAALAFAVAGCSNSGSSSSGSGSGMAASSGSSASSTGGATHAKPKAGGNIKLVYVEWSSCTAATNVIKSVLQKQGIHVDLVSVSGAAMYTAVADGDADATVCAWLPTTQANYYAKTRDKLDNLGPNLDKGTRLGLVVPDYVTINSIPQLKTHADKFQDRIIGIDPGAGEMSLTQKVIKQYKLPLRLVAGSGATMTAELKSAIQNRKWVVVTGWSPHWMWARWKLKYLKDPKGVYGKPDSIDTLVRKGLKKTNPVAYAILDKFQWTPADMETVMANARKPGNSPASSAKQWVAAHPDKVSAWTGGAQ